MIDLARYDSLTILAFFSANYCSLNEDALNLNLFTKVGNQIFDVANRTQSPYILNHTFAAVPVLTESKYDNEIRLGYTPLFYGNTFNAISTVQIDFLDGTGYQNLYANDIVTPLTKNYSDSSGFKKFSVKVIYADGTSDECYTGQIVNVIPSSVGTFANRYEPLSNEDIANPAKRIAPTSYLNINPIIPGPWLYYYPNAPLTQKALRTQRFNQDMKVYIRYKKRDANDPLLNKIVKPFIVVEGYDLTDASPLLKPHNYNINTLIKEWDGINLTSFDFNKQLDETAGYDFIFIDYYTMGSITENADFLLQAIDWINSEKKYNAAGVREQNVVMGISMGGLVSRYALAKRTKITNTNTTETKQLITMDTPHQGSNVPIGLQHFLYDFGETKIVKKIGEVSDDLKAFYYANTLPSTQQMLILRVTDGNGGLVANTFLAPQGEYHTMVDYASPYPFYAVSNGSQCAVPIMQPSTLLLKKEGNVATANWLLFFWKNKYRLNIQVNALPAYGTQSQVCSVVMERNIRMFWGAIGTGWHTTSNTSPRISPTNTIPWDGVPGGTKSTEAGGAIGQTTIIPDINIKNKTFLGNVWRSFVYIYLGNIHTNIQLPFSQKDFCFVPITSALDVQNVTSTTFTQPFNFAMNGLTGSRSNKFISQDFASKNLYNIEHTDFTARNAKWIYNQMEPPTIPPTTDCDDICTSLIKIDGPDNFCTSSDFTIPNLPSYMTVIWSSSNTNVATVTQNGNVATVTKVSDGSFTLTASINFNGGNNCNIPITLTKIIYVGNPLVSLQANNSAFDFCSVNLLQFDATVLNPSPPFSMHWSVIGNGARLKFGAGTASPVFFIRSTGTFEIIGEISNSCGTTNYSSGQMNGADLYSSCNNFRYSVSPNPSKENIKISFETGMITKKNIVFRLYTINNSHVVKEWNQILNTETKQLSLSTLGLTGGHYILEAIHDKKKHSMHIVIE